MKKFLIIVIILFLLQSVLAAPLDNEPISYNDATNAVKEVMLSYYLRADAIQYNHPKATWGIYSPEEATNQDILYDVCSAYVNNVYHEAFGFNYSNSNFPRYTSEVQAAAKK